MTQRIDLSGQPCRPHAFGRETDEFDHRVKNVTLGVDDLEFTLRFCDGRVDVLAFTARGTIQLSSQRVDLLLRLLDLRIQFARHLGESLVTRCTCGLLLAGIR